VRHKTKAVLSRFLVDRIHRDWIDRLFPQGWKIEKKDRGGGEGDTAIIPIIS